MPDWISALGDGWLGKAIFGLIAFTVAWFTRRPAERASIMLAVDRQIETAMNALGAQLKAANTRCDELAEQHDKCEAKLVLMRDQIDALMRGEVPPDWTHFAPNYKRPKP